VATGYSATGYGLAIRDEKDKSSMGFEIGTLRIRKCGVSVYVRQTVAEPLGCW
jgi:hypothetical protein